MHYLVSTMPWIWLKKILCLFFSLLRRHFITFFYNQIIFLPFWQIRIVERIILLAAFFVWREIQTMDGQNCEDVNFTHRIHHPIPKWRFMNFHKFFNWSDCFLWQKTITDKEKGKRRLLKCILIGRINRENSYS